ncbi:predicted protein [Botrytis cinerea T4]|uniref:Uncharacterized protein n=1 Tax=Botryotinia fuckeliana (strain T4) TaxID=999810 RepID=G2Y2L2_BOTF4|nr:predicted protein [Botrytis cinerea T4]
MAQAKRDCGSKLMNLTEILTQEQGMRDDFILKGSYIM